MDNLLLPNSEFRLHHIGYATRDTDRSIEAFKPLFDSVEHYRVLESSQGVWFTYLGSSLSGSRVELVEPATESSAVDGVLGNNELVPYHLCFEVSDFSIAASILRQHGFVPAAKAFTPGFDDTIVLRHFYSVYGGIVEILGKR